MASIDEAIERGVKNAFERPQETLGGRSLNQLLAEFHTGEIAPVVHGRWRGYNADCDDYQRNDGKPIFLICSMCNHMVLNNGSANWNYCPQCGAKMDGERKEGNCDG